MTSFDKYQKLALLPLDILYNGHQQQILQNNIYLEHTKRLSKKIRVVCDEYRYSIGTFFTLAYWRYTLRINPQLNIFSPSTLIETLPIWGNTDVLGQNGRTVRAK